MNRFLVNFVLFYLLREVFYLYFPISGSLQTSIAEINLVFLAKNWENSSLKEILT